MKKLLTILLALTMAACASSGTQVSQQAATAFKEGVTTEQEIINTLGNPTSVSITGNTKIISYSGYQYKTKAATFIPVVGLFAGGADYAHTVAMYFINKDGILTKINYTSSGSGSRQGTVVAPMTTQDPKSIQ